MQAVVTKSFERIHRSNLIGMGVLPLNFKDSADYDKLALDGSETFGITGIDNDLKPQSEATMTVHRAGGILPYVLAQIIRENA